MGNNVSNDIANIIVNSNFSQGLHAWNTNSCDGFVVSGNYYAVVTNRKKCWQGLEQNITHKISTGCTYSVTSCVGVWGCFKQSADVLAILRLEFKDSATRYLHVGRVCVSNGVWAKLEGTFSLATMPERVVFYLEGPSPGLDLLVKSVSITLSGDTAPEPDQVINGHGKEEVEVESVAEKNVKREEKSRKKMVLIFTAFVLIDLLIHAMFVTFGVELGVGC